MKTEKSHSEAVPTGRRDRQKAATRTRIFKAALDLLARQEYKSTTIEQITGAADVGKGTYFNYFESKEHLLYEVGEKQLAVIRITVEKALDKTADVKQVFRDIFSSLTELFVDNPILARNLLLANLGNDSARELMVKNVADRTEWLTKLAQQGQKCGSIRKDIKPEMVADWYLHVYFGNLLYWALQSPAEHSNWAQFSFEQFWTSVASGGSRGED